MDGGDKNSNSSSSSLSGTKRSVAEAKIEEVTGRNQNHRQLRPTNAKDDDPIAETFGNGLILTNILFFLDSEDIASSRRVAKSFNSLGLKVLKHPLHPKKAFETNDELRDAVWRYCHGQRRLNHRGEPATSLEQATTASDQCEIKSTYGFVIGKWDVSQVTEFDLAFYGLAEFNEPLEWDTRKATNMAYMFKYAESFNSSLGPNFCTSKVTNMSHMFSFCETFNQSDVSKFDTSNVVNMYAMFGGCRAFDQDISNFDTSKVRRMCQMLEGATSFNQSLKGWDTSKVESIYQMLTGTPLAEQHRTDPRRLVYDIWTWDLSSLQDVYFLPNLDPIDAIFHIWVNRPWTLQP